jgi:coenzyme PQQ synthesis protein D (PqqD)
MRTPASMRRSDLEPTSPDMRPELPRHVHVAEDVVWQMVDGEAVLFVVAAGRYYGLDDVGSRMWEVLQEFPDASEACDRLCAIYDVDDETLRSDLAAFIARLADAGLLRVDA